MWFIPEFIWYPPPPEAGGIPTAFGILRFAVHHLGLRLESAGGVIQVDSGLGQPAGTPIPTQAGCRLGVTFLVAVETDVLRPVHVDVERPITRLTETYRPRSKR
jgi:hypothetical protein